MTNTSWLLVAGEPDTDGAFEARADRVAAVIGYGIDGSIFTIGQAAIDLFWTHARHGEPRRYATLLAEILRLRARRTARRRLRGYRR